MDIVTRIHVGLRAGLRAVITILLSSVTFILVSPLGLLPAFIALLSVSALISALLYVEMMQKLWKVSFDHYSNVRGMPSAARIKT